MTTQIIYTEDTFDSSTAVIGDLVEQQVVNNFMDCLPPASYTSECAQLGEPYSHRSDENGKYKATYLTFKRLNHDTWVYCGKCFRGQNTEPKEV